jgi:nucleotide-binding universal stress UspA family protein
MHYRKILVPVDGSENAALACRQAVGLARACGIEIVLLYCYGDIPNTVFGLVKEEILTVFRVRGEEVLAPCAGACREVNVACKVVVSPGAPGQTIVQTAESEGCDLIVMGSRGLSDFPGMVMGSVSHKVLRHSNVPVLIVR